MVPLRKTYCDKITNPLWQKTYEKNYEKIETEKWILQKQNLENLVLSEKTKKSLAFFEKLNILIADGKQQQRQWTAKLKSLHN